MGLESTAARAVRQATQSSSRGKSSKTSTASRNARGQLTISVAKDPRPPDQRPREPRRPPGSVCRARIEQDRRHPRTAARRRPAQPPGPCVANDDRHAAESRTGRLDAGRKQKILGSRREG